MSNAGRLLRFASGPSGASLIVLGGGAIATFAANVVARRLMSGPQFVEWAYLTSLIALFFSFSLLGSEQLVVRTARVRNRVLELAHEALIVIALSFLGFGALFLALLDGRLFRFSLGMLALPMLVSIGAIQLVYQVQRARGRLLSAQVALNLWKFVLLPFTALAVVALPGRSALAANGAALAAGAVAAAWVILRERGAVRIAVFETDAFKVIVPFALSLGTLALLNVVDRVLIERNLDATAFADYFYTFTMIVTPFGLLSNFFGFKEAVRYRTDYSRAAALADSGRILALSALAVLAWLMLCYFFRGPAKLVFEPVIWGSLGVLAAVRCSYSVLSAAMGVQGSPGAIFSANVATLLGIVVLFVALRQFDAGMRTIVVSYTGVWCLRMAAYAAFIPPSMRSIRSTPSAGAAE